jgi:hypothetical protein
MKTWLLLAPLAALIVAAPARAVDHNNIDENHPLSFDDAESMALHERAMDLGLRLGVPRHRAAGLGAELEFLYGFALNSHLRVGINPSIGGRAHSNDTSFDIGDVSVGAFHSFNREHDNAPAFALRGDVLLPTGRGSHGTELRLRGIMSKTARQYDRIHLNLDLGFAPNPDAGEREFRPGMVLGYTRPLGYPRGFTRTGLAELAVQSGAERGTGPVVSLGVGLRQQMTVRSVFDLGLQSDIASFRGAAPDRIRLIAGYSTGY